MGPKSRRQTGFVRFTLVAVRFWNLATCIGKASFISSRTQRHASLPQQNDVNSARPVPDGHCFIYVKTSTVQRYQARVQIGESAEKMPQRGITIRCQRRYFSDDHTLRTHQPPLATWDHFSRLVDSVFHFQLFRAMLKKPSSTDFFLALLSLIVYM